MRSDGVISRRSTDEFWNGVDDSRRRGSTEATGGQRSAPGVSVVPGVPNRPLRNGPSRAQRPKPCGRRLMASVYPQQNASVHADPWSSGECRFNIEDENAALNEPVLTALRCLMG